MTIYKLHYNWFYTTDEGEYYSVYEVGVNCIKMDRFVGGGKVFCEVFFADGEVETIFNINQMFFRLDKKVEEEVDE